MAVQAQYPANVLLFNNRNVQEVKEMLAGEYPMQSHQTSAYLDHSNIIFSNGGGAGTSSSRKRGREAPINLFSLQSQSPAPTLVHLSQLYTPPQTSATLTPAPCVVSTGLGLSLHDQQQELALAKPSSSLLSSSLLDELATQINQQNEEIGQLLRAQADQLRRVLTEKYRALLTAAEESGRRQLRRKEAEAETAAQRRAQAWRSRARVQEAAAATLQAQLRQAMASATAAEGSRLAAGEQDGGEDAGTAAAEDAESAHIDPDRVEVVAATVPGPPACRACRRRYVSVVLMPCRHLCVCEECESVVRTCPICRVPSSGRVQVYL